MNNWLEKTYDFQIGSDCRLYYCGKRNKSVSHHYGPYTRDVYLLNFVKEGLATFQVNGENVTIKTGDFYVLYPNSQVSYHTAPDIPWSIQWVAIDGTQIETILSQLQLSRQKPYFAIRQTKHVEFLFDCLFENTNHLGLAKRFASQAVLYELFSHLAEERLPITNNPHIQKSFEIINEQFCTPLTVQDIADQLHLNNNYFSKLFKQETGISPMMFLQKIRFERASDLFKNTDLSVAEVSQAVGFTDPLYFSRAFKQHFGCNPSSYRNC